MNIKIILLGLVLLCGSMTIHGVLNREVAVEIQEKDMKIKMPPKYLYKVLSGSAWKESQGGEFLILSTDDEAFVHLSTSEQLDRIIGKYWVDNPDFVVLEIETEKLQGDLLLEANPGGVNKYYHLYNAAIPIDSVNCVL